jgi:hypothetical protein
MPITNNRGLSPASLHPWNMFSALTADIISVLQQSSPKELLDPTNAATNSASMCEQILTAAFKLLSILVGKLNSDTG